MWMLVNNVFSTQSNDALFEELVDQHGESLIRLAFTYVKDRQVAEDIVQDVFMRAYEKRNDFKGDSTYKTYLFRITVNRSYDYLRSWTYKNTVLSNKIASVFQNGHSAENEMLLNNEKYILGKEVFALPVKYREVLILFYYQDFNVDEIAELLICSSNTVKTRLRRGRTRLKEQLELKGGY
jgi:RNA polymerase sigma-70 factor (family 1)